jgi:AraC-like DNA-binding protein
VRALHDAPSTNVPAESEQPGPRVVALVPDRGRMARVRAAFGDQVRFCASSAELLAAGRLKDVELVIVLPHDQTGKHALTTTIAAIRASRRSAPVIVYGDRSIECVKQLMALAHAGARGVILFDVDDDAASLRRLLVRGTLAGAVDALTMALHPIVTPRHLPLFLACLEHVVEPPSAASVARRLNVSRRTLSAWARQAGARGVRSMTSKCRVLVAIEMIRSSDRSLEHVAHELGFSSSAHLHNTVTRYTGKRPRDAAADDLVTWCRRLFTPPPRRTAPAAERDPPPAEWSRTPNDTILTPANQAVVLGSTLT